MAFMIYQSTSDDIPAYNQNLILQMHWCELDFQDLPLSAKVSPIWVAVGEQVDIVFLTEDHRYFVSVDNKRVYPLNEIKYWTMQVRPTSPDFK